MNFILRWSRNKLNENNAGIHRLWKILAYVFAMATPSGALFDLVHQVCFDNLQQGSLAAQEDRGG